MSKKLIASSVVYSSLSSGRSYRLRKVYWLRSLELDRSMRALKIFSSFMPLLKKDSEEFLGRHLGERKMGRGHGEGEEGCGETFSILVC